MKRHCLALDLKEAPSLIAKYEAYHKNVWPEVLRILGFYIWRYTVLKTDYL